MPRGVRGCCQFADKPGQIEVAEEANAGTSSFGLAIARRYMYNKPELSPLKTFYLHLYRLRLVDDGRPLRDARAKNDLYNELLAQWYCTWKAWLLAQMTYGDWVGAERMLDGMSYQVTKFRSLLVHDQRFWAPVPGLGDAR